jgi:hypothetical protein
VARDYQAELREIEKQRIASNEAARAESQAERDRLEGAIREYPEHAALYKEAIDASRATEESYVNANDKLAANKVSQVESDQKAESESVKEAAAAPPPSNDNRETAFSNLAAQDDPAFPRTFDNAEDYQSAAKDLVAQALESAKAHESAVSELKSAQNSPDSTPEQLAALQDAVEKADEQRKADQVAVSKLELANPEFASGAAAPEATSNLPSMEKVLDVAAAIPDAAQILTQVLNPTPQMDMASMEAQLKNPPPAIESVSNPSPGSMSMDQVAEKVRESNNLDDLMSKAVRDPRDVQADVQANAKKTSEALEHAETNARTITVEPPPVAGGASPSDPAPQAAPDSPTVARVEMREPAEGPPAKATHVDVVMVPAPPPPPPPPPVPANDNTLQQ